MMERIVIEQRMSSRSEEYDGDVDAELTVLLLLVLVYNVKLCIDVTCVTLFWVSVIALVVDVGEAVVSFIKLL